MKNSSSGIAKEWVPFGEGKGICIEHVLHETHCIMHFICIILLKATFKEITPLEDGDQEVSFTG